MHFEATGLLYLEERDREIDFPGARCGRLCAPVSVLGILYSG